MDSPTVILSAIFVGLEAEDACGEGKTPVMPLGSIPLTTPVSSPDRGFDEGETSGAGESVTEPPLDERDLSVQKCSAGCAMANLVQPPWVDGPFQAFTPRGCAANLE